MDDINNSSHEQTPEKIFNSAFIGVYNSILDKQAIETGEYSGWAFGKKDYYEDKLPFHATRYKSGSGPLFPVERDLIESIIAETIDPGEKIVPTVDEARKAYRTAFEKEGVGAQTSKLLAMQTEKDVREVMEKTHPQHPQFLRNIGR